MKIVINNNTIPLVMLYKYYESIHENHNYIVLVEYFANYIFVLCCHLVDFR